MRELPFQMSDLLQLWRNGEHERVLDVIIYKDDTPIETAVIALDFRRRLSVEEADFFDLKYEERVLQTTDYSIQFTGNRYYAIYNGWKVEAILTNRPNTVFIFPVQCLDRSVPRPKLCFVSFHHLINPTPIPTK